MGCPHKADIDLSLNIGLRSRPGFRTDRVPDSRESTIISLATLQIFFEERANASLAWKDLIAASICDLYSFGPSIRPICTR